MNMTVFNPKLWYLLCLFILAPFAQTGAAQVTYTLQAIADGKLGADVFGEALVTIVMRSDTSTVKSEPSPSGTGFLFTNVTGDTEITVAANGHSTTARFADGEIYVYYDTGAGVAGFGSKRISPSYPISLDCRNDVSAPPPYVRDCTQGDHDLRNGTLAALADLSTTPAGGDNGLSPLLKALHQSLTKPTLLTGRTHSCAGLYTVDQNSLTLQACDSAAREGLRTDHGLLRLQDNIGGASPRIGAHDYYGWDEANVGYLHIEVSDGEDSDHENLTETRP
jgi:hypothetical protein